MRLKNIILSSLALAASVSVAAQETKTEYIFNPHWYVQAQFGAQYTLGEDSFGKLLSPNVQISGGYEFNKFLGARLSVNAWQSRAAWDSNYHYNWKWNYIAPSVDAVFNLSNALYGYNPERVFNLSVFGGIGMNIGFNNDDAVDVNGTIQGITGTTTNKLRNLWDGTKVRLQGRLGLMADFRVSDHVDLGVELQAATLSDHYNSKRSSNADWFFNALVGVKYHFGKTYTKKTTVVPVPVVENPDAVQKVVEKIVTKEVPGPIREIVVVEPLRQDIYFPLSSDAVSLTEMQKVEDLAAYLKKFPNAKISITGYADKDTGSPQINMKLSQKRAQVVADTLMNKFGIDESRITVKAMGDTEQPHAEQILNRVSVCIAK